MNMAVTGWVTGLIGVLIFSGSLPATRVAVGEFDPLFLTCARAAIAAILGLFLLILMRPKRPDPRDFGALTIVALGVVIGFPLLTALALQHVSASHSTVFIGLLPLATAIFGVLRGAKAPSPIFWLFSLTGSLLVAGFALSQSGTSTLTGDLLMLAAILACGLGYAEGAKLSQRLGGWQVISWALLLSFPFMACLAVLNLPDFDQGFSAPAWISLAYVSIFSMLVGFVFWYHGLAHGGIAGVSQLQLLQPFFSLLLAGLLLGETVTGMMIAVTGLVVCCVFAAKRFAS